MDGYTRAGGAARLSGDLGQGNASKESNASDELHDDELVSGTRRDELRGREWEDKKLLERDTETYRR